MTTLLPHQYKALERIVARCHKQNGILLFHEMGTGKTLTSLSILLNFKHEHCVVFCPEQLKYVWKNEMKKYDLPLHHVEIRGFDDLFTFDFRNKVIIIDEAHNVSFMLKNMHKHEESLRIIFNMKKAKKMILLSGTPIYSDITDLGILVNIASGKNIVPYTKSEFRKRYMKISLWTSLFRGYLIPYLNTWSGPLVTLGALLIPMINIIKSKIGNYVLMIENYRSALVEAQKEANMQNLKMSAEEILQVTMLNVFNGWPLKLLRAMEEDPEGQETLEKIANLNIREKMNEKQAKIYDAFQKKFQGNTYQIIFVFLLLPLSFITIINIVKSIDRHSIETMYNFNLKNFSQDLAPYIDYHKPEKYSNFPRKKMKTIKVRYNNYQISEWFRLLFDVQNRETSKLDERDDQDPDSLFFTVSKSNYLHVGRVIGNLSNEYSPPPKFIQLLHFIKKHKGNHLIYSSFYRKGTLLLSGFFKQNQINHEILTPYLSSQEIDQRILDFKNNKFNVLLLHYKYSEGISIPGVRYLHILEPVLEYHTYNQIIGRTLRTDSHTHLPKHLHFVEIIDWVCTSKTFIFSLSKMLTKLNIWRKFYPRVLFTKMPQEVPKDATPDELIYNLNDNLLNMKNRIQKIFRNRSFANMCDHPDNNIKCIVSTPTKKGDCSEFLASK